MNESQRLSVKEGKFSSRTRPPTKVSLSSLRTILGPSDTLGRTPSPVVRTGVRSQSRDPLSYSVASPVLACSPSKGWTTRKGGFLSHQKIPDSPRRGRWGGTGVKEVQGDSGKVHPKSELDISELVCECNKGYHAPA